MVGTFSSFKTRFLDLDVLVDDDTSLRIHLCANDVAIVSVDSRTGRLTLRDTGELAAAGRGPRLAMFSEKLNENPYMALVLLRFNVNIIYVFVRYCSIADSATTSSDNPRTRRTDSKLFGTADIPDEKLLNGG